MQTVACVLNKAGLCIQDAGGVGIDLFMHAYEAQPCNYVQAPGSHAVCQSARVRSVTIAVAVSVYFYVLICLLMPACVFLPIDRRE